MMVGTINLRRGFTLIELMVVITIIGILMAIIYVNFNESRKSARDKIRQTTLSDLQLAVEQYKAQNGQYPERGCGSSGSWATTDSTNAAGLTTAVCTNAQQFISASNMAGFITSYPDPTEAVGQSFMYFVNADRTAYKIITFGTIESTNNQFSSYADTKKFAACPPQCPRTTVLCGATSPHPTTYAVYSVGGECL
ncbi:prepilin-type N-terminal cleavage/methylation domain-containing protein [Patescibacteria group bacterium]|nr:prepilin-type N-terminal cleavage/methylation domain-containing protein [Patescibacteria group bacterium]